MRSVVDRNVFIRRIPVFELNVVANVLGTKNQNSKRVFYCFRWLQTSATLRDKEVEVRDAERGSSSVFS
jgi:hypothetical protein